jgi:hypothetical protein
MPTAGLAPLDETITIAELTRSLSDLQASET